MFILKKNGWLTLKFENGQELEVLLVGEGVEHITTQIYKNGAILTMQASVEDLAYIMATLAEYPCAPKKV